MKEYAENRQHKEHEITDEEWENCKNYFNYRCGYCGLPIEEHFIQYRGKTILGDFHKEHVIHNGSNDLSNCIPACKSCNCTKNIFDFEYWYKEKSGVFNEERFQKIIKWLNEDYVIFKDK